MPPDLVVCVQNLINDGSTIVEDIDDVFEVTARSEIPKSAAFQRGEFARNEIRRSEYSDRRS